MSNRSAQWAVDHAELSTLEARYAVTWDRADARGWAECFTRDGSFEIAAVGDRQPLLVEGADALERFCADFTDINSGVHLPSIPLLEIERDSATGVVNFHYVAVARLGSAHSISRTASGHYNVRYRRSSAGWRIEHRLERAAMSARAEYFSY